MIKMRKLFLKLSMLLFVLAMSINTAWADDGTIYYASLKAQTDPASTGSGRVKLTWLDITGKQMEVDLAKQLNWAANSSIDWTNQMQAMSGLMYMGGVEDWDEVEGAKAYSGPATTAQVLGGTMIAIEGTEVAVEIGGSGSQIYMTSMVYFHAEGFPENGSYLADWTFTDPQITRINSSMNPADPMGDGSEERPYRTPCFKVLPTLENSAIFPGSNTDPDYDTKMAGVMAAAQNTQKNSYNNIYALFSKYLLSNPVATNAVLEATPNAEANLTVTVEINGDAASLDAADFATFTFTNNGSSEWTYDLATALAAKEVVSAQKTRITIPVTYTYKNTGYGLKNTTMTISMAGASPSTLNVNLSANALDPERPEAFLLEGKDDASPLSGDLADILATDISGYTNPIVKLNKPVATSLTFSDKDFTLDLNGNVAQAITVSSGNVTIAYSSYGGSATSLTVNGGKTILNGGTFGSLTIDVKGTVEQNGATITGAATNSGSLTTTEGTINGGLTSSQTLVMNGGTFKGATAVTISGGTAAINRGAIEGTTCGLKVTNGTATTKKLAAIKGATYSAQQTGGTLTVESGKFDGPLNGTIAFTAGFFKTNTYGVSTTGKTEMNVSAGVEYNEGYRYFLGTTESALANGVGVCRIGTTSYARLEDAIAYANNNPLVENIVIFMTNDYTLPAGYYTLPANATIVVPMSDSQEKEVNMTTPRIIFNDQRTETPYTSIQPTEFRRLTFASGVNMDMFGDIELTCSQYASNEAYTAQPVGPYGRLVMEEGSHITLQSGSEFRAWGFVTGKGEMDARRGAKVREMFQLGDWKGAFTSVGITGMAPGIVPDKSSYKIFPVTQYFIQNIESPVKYHPGAVLSTSATVSEGLLGMSISMAATDIAIVGVSGQHQAIFLMDQMADADNTWVRKWYDSENDIQVYDINSAAHIGSMVLDMGDVNLLTYGTVPIRLNSANFDLPLTSNFKIHLLSGTMDFKQNTSLLPGAEVEVDKESTVTVAMDEDEKDEYEAWVAGGKSGDAPVCYTGALYVYDADEWDKYAYRNEYDGLNFDKGTAYTKVVRYAPSWNGRPTKRDEQTKPASAKINVHGTFQTATGFVYTSESGANIFSSNEDAGTFIFNDDAENAGTREVYNVKGSSDLDNHTTFYPAKLKNGNGEHVNTASAEAGDAYCYQNDEWSTMTIDRDDNCFMVKYNGNTDTYTYFAKPQEYVALANGKTENEDHTYSDAAGTGRLFILMGAEDNKCQWWEVEKKDNLYHCIHPDNDTYYYWGEDNNGVETWIEKKFTITWLNWDGTAITTNNGEEGAYKVTYGTMAEFLGTNPTREKTIDYTYDFTGWNPTPGIVTSDVTYTATFEQKDRMYTITFLNEGGTLIETQFLKHNEMPVCENVPTRTGYILQWEPAIGAVTGNQTYTATWLPDPPTTYAVTFADYDGTVLKKNDASDENAVFDVDINGTISNENLALVPTPTKKQIDQLALNNKEYNYEFDHWQPAVTDPVTQPTIYTAVYREVAKTYVVRFLDEDGNLIPGEEYNLPYGAMPVCSNTPTKENTAEWTYGFAWTPQIQTVMASEDPIEYRATFPATKNKYTVTLTSNLSGVCTFTGAGTYDYGTEITNVAVSYDDTKYTFNGWSDLAAEDENKKNSTHPSFTLEGDITLTANFSIKENAIPNLEIAADGSETLTETTEVKDFVLTSNGVTSGEIIGANHLDIKGEAIFRMQPETSFAAGQWYAVAVPWRVDPATGIYGASGRLASGSQIYIIEFDGTAYANVGGTDDTNQYWHFLHETGADMVPGKLYMIYLASVQSKLDFHKKAGAALQTRNLTVSTASGSADASFANWNAISNPALYTADLSTGVTAYQTYDNNGDQTYTVVNASTSGLIVAKPIFVQVNTPGTVYATVPSGPDPAPAYRPVAQAENDAKYVIEISRNGKMADRLIVETADEKENRYVIGQDLSKFGVSSKVAQMWINRYDSKLCKNTVEFDGERAEYPLSIFAPAAGDYTITNANANANAEYALYLTLNGEAIWNLSDGAYTLNLNKGTISNYGLRVSARAPQVVTGVDEAIVDAQGDTRKVLINNQVFIIRGNNVYSIDGQLIR